MALPTTKPPGLAEEPSQYGQPSSIAPNAPEDAAPSKSSTQWVSRSLAERYRAVFERAPDAVLVFNVQTGRYIDANLQAELLFGYPRDQLCRMSPFDLSSPHQFEAGDISSLINRNVAKACAGASVTFDWLLLSSSSREIWAEVHLAPLPDERASLLRINIKDVTSTRRADHALRESEQRVRVVLDATSEGFFDWNIETGEVFYSDQWLRNLGYEPGELPANVSTWESVIHPDDLVPAEEVLKSRLIGEKPIHYSENRLRCKSGEYRWFADRGRVVERAPDGRALRMVGTDADITELKQAEAGRLRAEAQLARAERMATVGVLAAGVAHEINNPLSYIMNNIDYALRELERSAPCRVMPEEVLAALSDAREGATRVRDIVLDLQTFSHGRDEELEWIDVGEVLESSLNIARNEIRHQAQLVLSLNDTPPVLANRARLGQVFLNLIVNALQALTASSRNAKSVTLSCRSEGTDVEVAVSDTGEGIAQADLQKIFDPFYTTKPVGVGSGLGLSICHNLLEKMGGSIHVESKVGVGTTFRVLLACSPHDNRSATDVPAVTYVDGQHLTTLIVDDDPLVARSVRRMLGSHHEIVVVGGAHSALQTLVQQRFDLVLCDVLMPGQSGLELLREVQKIDPALVSRFVFMTGGWCPPELCQQVAQFGAPCISKPFSVDELNAALGQVLASTTTHPGAAR